MAKNTGSNGTNFPEYPLAITGQKRPSSTKQGNPSGNRKTGLVSGRKVSGGS